MCNDIGEASYVDSLVAAAFLETARRLPSAPAIMQRLRERYKLDLAGGWAQPGGVAVCSVAEWRCGIAAPRVCMRHRNGTLGSGADSSSPASQCPCLPLLLLCASPPDYQGEEYVHALGDRMFNEEPERAGQRILKDFRALALGRICLELPDQFAAAREV